MSEVKTVDVVVDIDPRIEELKNMTFKQYLSKHLCSTVVFSVFSVGLWMGLEYYLYLHRVEDYVSFRNHERRDFLRRLKMYKYNGHFNPKDELIITKT